jgi:hypothetical protein
MVKVCQFCFSRRIAKDGDGVQQKAKPSTAKTSPRALKESLRVAAVSYDAKASRKGPTSHGMCMCVYRTAQTVTTESWRT